MAAINRVGRLEEENKALQDEIAELKLQQLSHKKEHDSKDSVYRLKTVVGLLVQNVTNCTPY